MDGTFYLGDKLYGGSLDFLKCLKKHRKDFYFFTNNSSKNVKYYIEKLKKMGCKIKGDKVLIPNQVIIQYIKKHMSDKKVYLLGTDYLKADFINADIEIVEADPGLVGVGTGVLDSYERIKEWVRFDRTIYPDKKAKKIYDQYFIEYKKAYESLKDIMKRLGKIE